MDNIITPKGRSRFSYPSVNTRIVVPFLLAIIVIAALGIYIVTRLVAGSIQERFNNQLISSANAASNTIVDIETDYLNTLRLMVFTDGVPEAISQGQTQNLDTWLRPIAATKLVDELLVLNVAGDPQLVLSRQATSRVVEYATAEAPKSDELKNVQRTLHGELDDRGDKFVDVVKPGEQGAVIYFHAPVIVGEEGSRQVVGVIVAGLRVESLIQQITQQSLSAVTILNQQGEILGTTLLRARGDQLQKTPQQIERLLQEMADSSPIETLEVDGVPYQRLFSPFVVRNQLVGVLSVSLSTNYIVEQSSTSRNLFGLLFAVFFVAVAVMGFMVSRTITNPIRQLVSTTRAIREGDLTRRVQLIPRDELGELGESFDIMTDELVRRNEEVVNLLHEQVATTAQREAVLASISDAVIVQDTEGKIILQNLTAHQLMNMLASDRQQRNYFASILHDPEALRLPQMVSFVDHHFSVLATPVIMDHDDLLGHVIVFRDITAIIESEKIKDELILQMSHELRTPLSTARGYVDLIEMIEGRNFGKDSLQYVVGAKQGLTTLERLVNQVIDVSTIISGRFRVDFDTFNLAYLVGDVFVKWQPAMKERGLNFSLILPTNDLFIEGDEYRIEQLIDHLLRNAHDYTRSGGIVEITAEAHDGFAHIAVTDSGKGIAANEIERVFERMYRGEAAMAGDTDSRGMGLGLYISEQIVGAHHGKIKIESAVDLGTIVTVELPIRRR